MAYRSSLRSAIALVLTLSSGSPVSAAEEQITFAVNITPAPTWFDPAETPGVVTPFLSLYALHDALVKPMPGNAWAPSLAESWTGSTRSSSSCTSAPCSRLSSSRRC
jgi:peptide/nickel transport system substrate-binding protein